MRIQEIKRNLIVWYKENKWKLVAAGIGIATVTVTFISLKDNESSKALVQQLNEAYEKAKMYSSKWFESVSDQVLNEEREKVRLDYCASGKDYSKAARLQNLLLQFDKELSKRAWGDETPHAPSIQREHGWYLPNDD